MRETLKNKKESLTADELSKKLFKKDQVYIFDVRSIEEFNSGHIQGAVHAPQEVLIQNVLQIPKNAFIVTNCGKGGGRSIEAMTLLRNKGWQNSYWLEGGYLGLKQLEDKK